MSWGHSCGLSPYNGACSINFYYNYFFFSFFLILSINSFDLEISRSFHCSVSIKRSRKPYKAKPMYQSGCKELDMSIPPRVWNWGKKIISTWQCQRQKHHIPQLQLHHWATCTGWARWSKFCRFLIKWRSNFTALYLREPLLSGRELQRVINFMKQGL